MNVSHHPHDDLLMSYAAGALSESWSLAVATHLSFCPECRASVQLAETVGGVLLADTPDQELSPNMLDKVLAVLVITFPFIFGTLLLTLLIRKNSKSILKQVIIVNFILKVVTILILTIPLLVIIIKPLSPKFGSEIRKILIWDKIEVYNLRTSFSHNNSNLDRIT